MDVTPPAPTPAASPCRDRRPLAAGTVACPEPPARAARDRPASTEHRHRADAQQAAQSAQHPAATARPRAAARERYFLAGEHLHQHGRDARRDNLLNGRQDGGLKRVADGLPHRLRLGQERVEDTARLLLEGLEDLPVVVAHQLRGPVGRVLARRLDRGVVRFVALGTDVLALPGQFRDPRLDLVGLVTQPLERQLLFEQQAPGIHVVERLLHLVDLLQIVDLDGGFLLLDSDLLLERYGIDALQLAQARVPFEARTLLLEGVGLPQVLQVLLRNVDVVLETLLVSLRLPLQLPVRGLLLVLEVIRERLPVLQREVVLERLKLLLHRVDDGGPRRLGERDLMRPLVIRERRAPCDLRVHLRNVLRVPGLPRAFRSDGLVLEVLLVLPLALLNLDGELQRLRIGLAGAADLDLGQARAQLAPRRLFAGDHLPAGDEFADLVVRHPAFPEVVDLGLAGEDVLAEGRPSPSACSGAPCPPSCRSTLCR